MQEFARIGLDRAVRNNFYIHITLPFSLSLSLFLSLPLFL